MRVRITKFNAKWPPDDRLISTQLYWRLKEDTGNHESFQAVTSYKQLSRYNRSDAETIAHGNFKKYWWPTANCAWFQASAAKYLKSALFWDITQYTVLIPYRRFGTTCRSIFRCQEIQEEIRIFFLDFLPLKMGPIWYPEMSVRKYHYTPRNVAEERSSDSKLSGP